MSDDSDRLLELPQAEEPIGKAVFLINTYEFMQLSGELTLNLAFFSPRWNLFSD